MCIYDDMHQFHTGLKGVNESLWAQSASLRYTSSKCQTWRQELKGLKLAQLGHDQVGKQIPDSYSVRKPGWSQGAKLDCWQIQPP